MNELVKKCMYSTLSRMSDWGPNIKMTIVEKKSTLTWLGHIGKMNEDGIANQIHEGRLN